MVSKRVKIVRTSTIAFSLDILLNGQLKYLNHFFEIVAVSGYDNHLETVRDREGVRIFNIPFKRNISILNDLLSLIKLYIFFLREKPQIVHSITPKAGLISMIAAKLAFVPIRMHTFTGLIFPSRTGLIREILILCDKIICWAATDLYPEGEGVKMDLVSSKITNKSLKIIAHGNVNGLDTSFFSQENFTKKDAQFFKDNLSIRDKDFVFLFVGRITKEKGINELVQVFEEICLKSENVKLILVGPEEFENDLLDDRVLNIINTNINIVKVGFQKDVRPYYLISDCLVLPSYREGFPNVLLQAGAMGLPSIVTDVNGSNEIIKNDLNGSIVSIKDKKALLKAMLKILMDNEYKSMLSSQSRNIITSRYEQSHVLHSLLQEYLLKLNNNNIVI